MASPLDKVAQEMIRASGGWGGPPPPGAMAMRGFTGQSLGNPLMGGAPYGSNPVSPAPEPVPAPQPQPQQPMGFGGEQQDISSYMRTTPGLQHMYRPMAGPGSFGSGIGNLNQWEQDARFNAMQPPPAPAASPQMTNGGVAQPELPQAPPVDPMSDPVMQPMQQPAPVPAQAPYGEIAQPSYGGEAVPELQRMGGMLGAPKKAKRTIGMTDQWF